MYNYTFLNLGMHPLANSYLKKKELKKKERKYKLNVSFNKKNFLVKVISKFSSKTMFNNQYPYRSSMSQTMLKSFSKLALRLKKMNNDKILEIGSNDGAFSFNFDKKKIICVEPCGNLAKITKKKGYKTYNEYWNFELSKKIYKHHGKINLIFSSNTISHIENLNDVFKSMNYILDKNGILIIEDPSLMECLKKNTYDQFYNEHIYVFSFTSLNSILKKHDLVIFDIENISTHGGSTRYYIKKEGNKFLKINNNILKQYKKERKIRITNIQTYINFAKRVKKSKIEFTKIINDLKSKNIKILGYGATAKSCTVLNFCKINNKQIEYFIDTTPEKQNKYTPGTHIPIVKKINNINPSKTVFYLGAWNFLKEIKKKEKNFLKKGGQFLIHTPYPKLIR
jgi:SAM-dependent methyltransferase